MKQRWGMSHYKMMHIMDIILFLENNHSLDQKALDWCKSPQNDLFGLAHRNTRFNFKTSCQHVHCDNKGRYYSQHKCVPVRSVWGQRNLALGPSHGAVKAARKNSKMKNVPFVSSYPSVSAADVEKRDGSGAGEAFPTGTANPAVQRHRVQTDPSGPRGELPAQQGQVCKAQG